MLECHMFQLQILLDKWQEPHPTIIQMSQITRILRAINRISYNTIWYASIIIGFVISLVKIFVIFFD